MNSDEFKTGFKRLCSGFGYEPRQAQAKAYFDRLSLVHAQDWEEAVTDLLCAPYFPKTLDVILDAVERRAEQRRRAKKLEEQHEDEQAAHRIERGKGCPFSKTLFCAIRAFGGRDQIRKYYRMTKEYSDEDCAHRKIDRDKELTRYRQEDERLTHELLEAMQQLEEQELSELIDRYGDQLTSGLEV